MAWTTQRKAFVGVLAVAGIALIADRAFFGAAPLGASPAAAAAQEMVVVKAALPASAPPLAAPSVPGITLVSRLEALRENAVETDPFESPFVTASVVETPDAVLPASPEFDGAAWAGRHKLSAVMNGKPSSFAIIGGKIFRVGDVLDGLMLVRIENQSALFEGEQGSAELLVRAGESK